MPSQSGGTNWPDAVRRTAAFGVVAVALVGVWGRQPARGLISDHTRAGPRLAQCVAGPRRTIYRDAEPYAAVDPRDDRHLVVAWQASGPGGGAIMAAVSFDAGATWSAPALLAVTGCGGGSTEAQRASDSWVAFGADGRVHVAGIGWRPGPDDGPDAYNALVVVSSADGGRSWDSGVTVARGDPAVGLSHDNVAIATDPRRPGVIYLTTTRYSRTAGPGGRPSLVGPVGFSSSADGGRTWRPMVVIGPNSLGSRVSAPQPIVDPRDGVVRVVYHRSDRRRQLIGMIASADGGRTWGGEDTVVAVQPGPSATTNPRDGERFVYAVDIVQVAQDPTDGALYLGYADSRLDSARTNGVSLVVSRDGGRRWSAPIAMRGTPGHQGWLPALAVGPAGEIGLGYLTSAFGANGAEATLDYRVARVRNRDGRLTIVADTLLDRGPLIWPGDYHALVATAAGFRLVTGRAPPVADSTNPTDIVIR